MAVRIVILSLLLTLVYSWEEFTRLIRIFIQRILGNLALMRDMDGFEAEDFDLTPHTEPDVAREKLEDQNVSIIIMAATLPIGLAYFVAGGGDLRDRLLILILVLLGVSVLALLSSTILTTGAVFSSLIMPSLAGLLEAAYLPRRTLAKFAGLLALPPLCGLIVHILNGSNALEPFRERLDILTVVLVGSLFLRIGVEFLEHYFRTLGVERFFSYYRVVLGIILAAVLLLN